MRQFTLLLIFLVLISISEAKKKPSTNKGACEREGPKLTKKNTRKYTAKPKGCPCWWDITKKKQCACCKKGVNAMQCGFPMHNYCYEKSETGCPGVCNNKYTLSQMGFPCFSDHSRTDCAWCSPVGYQCEVNGKTGPDSKFGSRCTSRTNKGHCKMQQGDCKHIPACDDNAECKFVKKIGDSKKFFSCTCMKGYKGNGIQCRDANGTLSVSPNTFVKVSLTLDKEQYTFPHKEGDYSHSASMTTLLSEMESANQACQTESCESSYSDVEL